MRAGTGPGAPLRADGLTPRNALSRADGDALHVPVDGDEAIAVIDVDGVPQAVRGPAGEDAPARLRRREAGTAGRGDVDAIVGAEGGGNRTRFRPDKAGVAAAATVRLRRIVDRRECAGEARRGLGRRGR